MRGPAHLRHLISRPDHDVPAPTLVGAYVWRYDTDPDHPLRWGLGQPTAKRNPELARIGDAAHDESDRHPPRDVPVDAAIESDLTDLR
jgi:hypothetical protein